VKLANVPVSDVYGSIAPSQATDTIEAIGRRGCREELRFVPAIINSQKRLTLSLVLRLVYPI
jgi:hypothetical protein